DPERALALDLGNPERMQDFRDFCERFARPDREYGTEQVYSCGAGQSSFPVDPYGRLQMCQLSRKSFHDLKRGRFAEGWHELFPMLRARTWQKNEICRKCSLMSLCGSCPGAAEMETGDIEGVVPAFCELAHLRAWAVMGEGSGHRRDATCCFGTGALAARADAAATGPEPDPAGARAAAAGLSACRGGRCGCASAASCCSSRPKRRSRR